MSTLRTSTSALVHEVRLNQHGFRRNSTIYPSPNAQRLNCNSLFTLAEVFDASSRNIAIYARVSSKQQDIRSQEPDLKRWAEAFADGPVKWYTDKASGRTMDRPEWKRLEEDLAVGKIVKIVVWRLDRLGRTAAGQPPIVRLPKQLRPDLSLNRPVVSPVAWPSVPWPNLDIVPD